MHDTTDTTDETDRRKTTIAARIGTETFEGEFLERGFDGEPVVYVRDVRGRERAVRPERPRHTISGEGIA